MGFFPTTGEANFDIDREDISVDSPHLWEEMDKPTKLTLFEDELRKRLLSGDLQADGAVFLFALQEGFLPRHAREVVTALRREGRIETIPTGLKPRISMSGYKTPRGLRPKTDGSF